MHHATAGLLPECRLCEELNLLTGEVFAGQAGKDSFLLKSKRTFLYNANTLFFQINSLLFNKEG